ncbi:MAG: hypothetical protein EXR07_08460 [Acetobacteraceae bacterium]|nr:hypothetical protein [Acetobacteraceae bacterium]
MVGLQKRMVYGFVAAVVSVLIFHQGVWALLHTLAIPGMTMPPPFPTDGVPPLGVPRIVSLCFWGGVWGAAFGAVWRGRRASYWWGGIFLGVAAALTSLFIVAAIKGQPIAGGWVLTSWIRSLLINGTWGLGVGLLLTAAAIGSGPRDEAENR